MSVTVVSKAEDRAAGGPAGETGSLRSALTLSNGIFCQLFSLGFYMRMHLKYLPCNNLIVDNILDILNIHDILVRYIY